MSLTVYQMNVVCLNGDGVRVAHQGIWSPTLYNTCPSNDPTHTWQETLIMANVKDTNVMIVNDSIGTNGNYRIQEFHFTAPAGPDTMLNTVGTHTFKYNVRIVNATFVPNTENLGDVFSLYVSPPISIGTLLTSVSSGNVLNISNSAITAMENGMVVILDDGTSRQDLDECVSIDYVAQTITVENTVVNIFDVGTNIYIRLPLARNITVSSLENINFGTNVEGNKKVDKGFVLEIDYQNKTASSKTIAFRSELLV